MSSSGLLLQASNSQFVCLCVCFTQELMSRTSLETQKLDLMDEVSFLKLKLVSMEETQHTTSNTHPQEPADTEQNKAEVCTVKLNS